MLKPIFESIPQELKNDPHWVNWRSVPRKDGGKPTKPPYQPNGKLAESNNPETWSTFNSVKEAADRFDGIGFVLTKDDSFIGIDLDHCRCPAFDNVILPWAQEIIDGIDSYTEASPSGKGIRLFVNGAPLPPQGRKKGDVEIYESGRYLTITGNHIPGTPSTIESRPEAVLSLHRRYFGNGTDGSAPVEVLPPENDLEIKEHLRKAFSSKKGKKFRRLYEGIWSEYSSQSEADLALCSSLAFWLDKDPILMDRAFRQSGLIRSKWDEKHFSDGRTYGQGVIEKAISSCKETYESKNVRSSPRGSLYFIDSQGYWCRWKQTNNGTVPIRLANFTAKIEEEILEDDGVEVAHRYVLKGQMADRSLPATDVPASSFAGLNWIPKWGSQAIIEPGQSIKDFVRHAIQVTSTDAKKSTRYTHTGWREIDGTWVFLSAGGGIGTDNVTVKLSPEMSRYALPLQPENELEAIRASLSFLDIGNRDVTLPLLAQTYLSALTSLIDPMPNFSGYLYGQTGTFKTTLSLVQLSHFGDFSTISNLPNFDDTANSLEKRAFILKDVLTVLDDYHPSQSRGDAMHKEQIAQRIIRAYSNRTARGRLNADTTDKGRYSPRGFLQVTGEEIISLPSTLARVFVVEIQPGDIDIKKLTSLQGRAHLLPHAMCSFIRWGRDHMEEIRANFPQRFRELRSQSSTDGSHRKLPEQIAFLRYALELVIGWMLDKKILSDKGANSLAEEGWNVFTRLSERHSQRIADDNPIKLFEEIMESLFTQGKVRLEYRTISGHAYGAAEGALIGYYDEQYVYMMPTTMWHELNRFCRTEDSHFPFTKTTFYKMLKDRKLIEPGSDGTNTTTVKIQGKTVRALKFKAGEVFKNCVTSVTNVTDD
jgi:hypothetical protein